MFSKPKQVRREGMEEWQTGNQKEPNNKTVDLNSNISVIMSNLMELTKWKRDRFL